MKAFYVSGEWVPKREYIILPREQTDEHFAVNSPMIWKNVHGELKEIPIPTPKADEVLIKVGACGICGSDLNAIELDEEGYTRFPGRLKLPVVLGHEYSGEVVEVGADVKSVRKGDLISVEQTLWCGKCRMCRMGWFNQCENIYEDGLSKNGGFEEYALVNEKFCCKINGIAERLGDKLAALEAGALVEPTAVVYNGMFLNAGGFQPGGHIVVFGIGAIGLAAIALARATGAASIIAFGTTEGRMKLARHMGADVVFNPRQLAKDGGAAPWELVMEYTKGIGAAMLIEATGNTNSTYPEIEKCMAVGAKVVQVGMEARRASVDWNPFMVNYGKIYGTASTGGREIFPSVIRMMEYGVIDMRKMVSARYHLDKIDEAFDAQRTKQHGKVLVSQHY
jgi:threonine dehydrogenase-like Zn-dependent dehydrogenase